MASEKEKQDSVEYLIKMAQVNGIATCPTTDGRVFVISKTTLLSLLDKIGDKEQALLFVKHTPEINDKVSN